MIETVETGEERLDSAEDLQAAFVQMLEEGTPANVIVEHLRLAGQEPEAIIPALSGAIRILRQWRQVLERASDHAVWMSDVRRACRNGAPNVAEVQQIGCEAFYRDYFNQNRPIVIKEAWYGDGARSDVSFRRLRDEFGDIVIEIAARRIPGKNDFVDHDFHKQSVTLAKFLDDVETIATNDFYLTSQNFAVRGQLGELVNNLKAFPSLMDLRRPLESALFIGPKGATSPLHYDGHNVLLLQLIGTKRVTLYCPQDECFLYYDNDIRSSTIDPNELDLSRYPLSRFARPTVVEVTAGNALFLPVGWGHYVESLTPTCSLSMYNFNGRNNFLRLS